jgi:hypothetical protein
MVQNSQPLSDVREAVVFTFRLHGTGTVYGAQMRKDKTRLEILPVNLSNG